MKKLCLALLVAVQLLSSCYKDTLDDLTGIKGVQANPSLAVPFINAEAGLGELVGNISDNMSVELEPDGKLVFVFEGADSLDETQYVNLPDLNLDLSLPMPPPAVPDFLSTGLFQLNVNASEPVSVAADQRIERVYVKEGKINLLVGSTFTHNTFVKITFPGIIKNGKSLVDSFEFIYTGSTPAAIPREVELAGALIDLTDNGTTFNVVPYNIDLRISKVGPDVELGHALSIDADVKIDKYSRAEGYFGKFTITDFVNEETLNVFDKKLDGNVFIRDPKLRLRLTNSIGMPVTAKLTELYVISGTGVQVPVNIDQFKDTFTLAYTSAIGQVSETEYVIDRTNSNIDVVLSSAPQKMVYKVSFTANTDQVVKPNVLYDYSTLKQNARFELPFDARVLHYAIETDGPLDLGDGLDSLEEKEGVKVEYAEAVSEMINNLPMDAYVQLFIEDTLGNVIDSVFASQYLIPSAVINSSGTVVAPTKVSANHYIESERYKRIMSGKKYRMQARFRTAEVNGVQPFVSFYNYQKLQIKLGMRAKVAVRRKLEEDKK